MNRPLAGSIAAPAGEAGVEAVGQRVGRDVGIGGAGGEGQRVAFGYRLVADCGQHWGLVDFGDGYGDRLGVG